MAYDIFISYRRNGSGFGVAGELQAKLENLGYKVFLDVDKISSGQFPEQIKQAITECKDFLLVLSPGTLDRCVDEEDWVRREIVMAQELNKNIVGVGLPGFIMPEEETLPVPLRSLATCQVFSWTHEYRAASFEKIEENLVSTKLKKKNRQKLFALLPIVLVLVVAVVLLVTKRSSDVVAVIEGDQQEAVNFHVEAQQLFESHAEKAMKLTQNLPDAKTFQENFTQMVDDSVLFNHLTEGIVEYDEALKLKEKYEDQIVDKYHVEAKKKELLNLRQSYFDAINSDIKSLINEGEGAAKFFQQDLKMARILALPDEIDGLDSLEANQD